jgi:hypothetical protein
MLHECENKVRSSWDNDQKLGRCEVCIVRFEDGLLAWQNVTVIGKNTAGIIQRGMAPWSELGSEIAVEPHFRLLGAALVANEDVWVLSYYGLSYTGETDKNLKKKI